MVLLLFKIILLFCATIPQMTSTLTPTSSITEQPHLSPSNNQINIITRNYLLNAAQPFFDRSVNNNVTAQLGSHAFLPCRVKQLGNKSVSWIRSRDSHILTVDRYTFIADERFQTLHNNYDNWLLQIKYVQERDAGPYECQITTEPKQSWPVQLNVVVPQTKILGGESDVFVKAGSSVVIKCLISDSLEAVDYIFWYHDGGRVLSIDNSGSYQHVERLSPDTTLGVLVIKSTSKSDSGNYTCAPSFNLETASIILHVLNGEHPASAMQQETQQSNSLATTTIATKIKIIILVTLIINIFIN